jgi:hypothetical protein
MTFKDRQIALNSIIGASITICLYVALLHNFGKEPGDPYGFRNLIKIVLVVLIVLSSTAFIITSLFWNGWRQFKFSWLLFWTCWFNVFGPFVCDFLVYAATGYSGNLFKFLFSLSQHGAAWVVGVIYAYYIISKSWSIEDSGSDSVMPLPVSMK